MSVYVGLSVGALTRRIGWTDRMRLLDEPFRIVQGHTAGEPPVVRLCGAGRAVRPAVLVHRQRVVRFGTLVFRTGANEVNAIIHLTD